MTPIKSNWFRPTPYTNRFHLLRNQYRYFLCAILLIYSANAKANTFQQVQAATGQWRTVQTHDYQSQSTLRSHPPALARTLGRLTMGHTLAGQTLPTVKGVDGPTWGSIVALDLVREMVFRISETFLTRAHQQAQNNRTKNAVINLHFIDAGEAMKRAPQANTPTISSSRQIGNPFDFGTNKSAKNSNQYWSSDTDLGFRMELTGNYSPGSGMFEIQKGLIDSNGSSQSDAQIVALKGYYADNKIFISNFTIHFQTNTGNTRLGVMGTRDAQGFLDMVAQTDVENDGIPDVTINYDNQGQYGNQTQITVQLDVEGNERGTGDGSIDATQSAMIEHHEQTERRLPVSIANVSKLSPNALRNLFFLSRAEDSAQFDKAFH